MNAAGDVCSITNPTVNSYKRINAPVTLSGATWSPNTVTYAGNNRTHMIRIPAGGRFEFRLADGAANPYLLPAALLAAGLDGIARGIDPGKPLDINMYAEGHKAPAGTKKLPLNLLDALRVTDKSEFLRRELGDEFVDSYIKLKMRGVERLCRATSPLGSAPPRSTAKTAMPAPALVFVIRGQETRPPGGFYGRVMSPSTSPR